MSVFKPFPFRQTFILFFGPFTSSIFRSHFNNFTTLNNFSVKFKASFIPLNL